MKSGFSNETTSNACRCLRISVVGISTKIEFKMGRRLNADGIPIRVTPVGNKGNTSPSSSINRKIKTLDIFIMDYRRELINYSVFTVQYTSQSRGSIPS